jgi:Ca2+-binding EF-hand superfamily protein
MELLDKRAQQLMEGFDVSGDGKLQLDEFVSVDKFVDTLENSWCWTPERQRRWKQRWHC